MNCWGFAGRAWWRVAVVGGVFTLFVCPAYAEREDGAASRATTEPASVTQSYNQEAAQSFSPNGVRAFVHRWFGYSDKLASYQDYLPMIADDCVQVFPDNRMNSKAEFVKWRSGTSSTLRSNTHKLSPISVKRIDQYHWFVAFDVEWQGTNRDGSMLEDTYHQVWLVDSTAGKLQLRRRDSQMVGVRKLAGIIPHESSLPQGNANQVEQMVYAWFAGFDRHCPSQFFTAQMMPGVKMSFPGFPIESEADFLRWYDNVDKTVAWNAHDVTNLQIKRGTGATWLVSCDVRWTAQLYSGELIDSWVHQEWVVGYDALGHLQLQHHSCVARP